MLKGKNNLVTHAARLNNVNLIAAVSNRGKFYFQVCQGNNNSETFWFFLMRLCLHLQREDPIYRKKTWIMLDNARFHRSKFMMEKYTDYGIPILFLGPYHFNMAPVEMMFAYIKNRDLNKLQTRANSR